MIVLGTLLTEHIYLLTVVYCCVASTMGLCVAKKFMFPIVKYCVAQIIIVVTVEIKSFIFFGSLCMLIKIPVLSYSVQCPLHYDTQEPKSNCSFPTSYVHNKKSK